MNAASILEAICPTQVRYYPDSVESENDYFGRKTLDTQSQLTCATFAMSCQLSLFKYSFQPPLLYLSIIITKDSPLLIDCPLVIFGRQMTCAWPHAIEGNA